MNGKQLRNSILQWAISGRLVPQDPNDEPAIELLKRINPKAAPITEKLPFTIPDSWCWCKLGDVISLLSGRDLEPNKYNSLGKGIPYMTGASNFDGGKLSINRWTEAPVTISKLGDLLITCKGTIGAMAFNDIGAIHVARQIMAISSSSVNLKYVQVFLMLNIGSLEAQANSMIPGIARNTILKASFPLPPLAEQERIVGKVEELLPLVERYDKAQTELNRLNASLKGKLRASVLQEAIAGRLVPQDPNDEPAIELLKRINPKFTPQPTDEPLPPGWTACKMGEVVNIMMGQSPNGSSINTEKGVEFHQGKIAFTEKYLKHSNKYTTEAIRIAGPNSLLVCVRAPVGDVNITERRICIGRGLCAVSPKVGNLAFYFYLLKTLKSDLESKATGSTFKAISKNTIEEEVINLPPLVEQERIVQKVEELFAVLDALQ